MEMFRTTLLTIAFFVSGAWLAQRPAFLSVGDRWVDSVFNSLTPDQRTAQLFMVAAYSNKDLKHVKEIKDLITKYNIGGLIWMQGGPVRQGKIAGYFQSIARTPLLYSIDGEWGLAMRLDSTPKYPKQMTLGAITNDSLIYRMGRQIGKECRRIGLHVNFAPVADVNNNPLNPVIGMRSFGEDKFNVAKKSYMYMAGMQDEFVMANGKHFPGHGDTESDSHATLPLMPQSAARLDSLELYPFRYIFDRGLASVMVAHLNIPALDSTRNQPSTLSAKVVTDLLKKKLGFEGLIFTDALNMKGVSKYFPPGVVDVKAIQAGNDVMLFSGNVPKAIAGINKAISDSLITRAQVDERCRKILRAKYWCGLSARPSIVTRNLHKELNTPESETLNQELCNAAVTMLYNKSGIVPFRKTDTIKVVSISFGETADNLVNDELRSFCYVDHVGIAHNAKPAEIREALATAADADMLLIHLTRSTIRPDNMYGVGAQTMRLIDSLAEAKPAVLCMFVNPYVVNGLSDIRKFRAIVMGYENLPPMQRAVAGVLVGSIPSSGKLPVTTKHFPRGHGIDMPALSVSEIGNAKETFRDKRFAAVDSLALYGIAQKAYPGCQIVAMKNGQVIYQKSFGAYTYAKDSKPVSNGSIYDLASVTKIASSSLALMKLTSEQKFDYRKTLGSYLPELEGTGKENILIEHVLTHQAGLPAFIPFYSRTLQKNGKYKPGYYARSKSDEFPTQVADHLFVVKGFSDTIYKRIATVRLEKPGKYVYSDIGYYFMHRIIEQQTGQKLEDYLHQMYSTLGIGLRYTPLKYFSRTQVVPTENDHHFRKQLIRGYVHDPGAALLGGVAGHAGLFGNALDVARVMQLYLDKGMLNGVQYLDSNVVKDFTSCHFCPGNRRGLCFEKPEPDLRKDSPVTSECSLESFGHSGFTGTFTWADPKNGLVIVFLSNRVFPKAEENKLVKLGIRGKIHKAFYDALKDTP